MVEQHLALECVRGRCGKYVESRDILDFDLKIDINLKEKFVTKMQNISSPLASKPIEEREDDTEEKRTIE